METKKIKTKDNTTLITWSGKLHSWDEAAYVPQGNKKLEEYYIHGIKYSKEEWKKLRKERNGVPWFKNPTMRNTERS